MTHAEASAASDTSTRRVMSESVAYTAIDAAQNLLALMVVPASLFWLTPADMGVVTLAMVGTLLAMTVTTLGFDFGVVRFYFEWPAAERRDRAAAGLLIVSVASLLLTLVVGLAGKLWWPGSAAVIVASVAAGTGLGVRAIPLAVFRVTSRLGLYAWMVISSSAIQAVLQIALLAAGLGVRGFLVSAAVAAWLSAVASAAAMLGRHPVALRWPDSATIRLAGWSLSGGLANRAASSVDRLVLSVWATTDALGVYGTASRWALPLRMVSGGTKLAIAPALSRAGSQSDPGAATAAIGTFVTLLSLLSVLLLGCSSLMLLTPWRPVVEDFQRVLTLLLAAQLISCLTLIGQVLLYYTGGSGQSTSLAVVSAVTGMAALLALVPRYGTTGAAIAQFVSSAVTLAVFGRIVGRTQWRAMRADAPLAVLAAALVVPWVAGPLVTAALSLVAAGLLAHRAWDNWKSWAGNDVADPAPGLSA